MTNPALLNALADDAKRVLSFTTPTKYQDPSDPLRSLITLHVHLHQRHLLHNLHLLQKDVHW